MTDFNINDYLLTKECDALAADIVAEVMDENQGDEPETLRDECSDRVHETVDGHQYVIYTYKAIQTAANCDCSEGEAFIEDVGLPNPVTFGSLATAIVYGEMRARVDAEVEGLLEAAQERFEERQPLLDAIEEAQEAVDDAETDEEVEAAEKALEAAQAALEAFDADPQAVAA